MVVAQQRRGWNGAGAARQGERTAPGEPGNNRQARAAAAGRRRGETTRHRTSRRNVRVHRGVGQARRAAREPKVRANQTCRARERRRTTVKRFITVHASCRYRNRWGQAACAGQRGTSLNKRKTTGITNKLQVAPHVTKCHGRAHGWNWNGIQRWKCIPVQQGRPPPRGNRGRRRAGRRGTAVWAHQQAGQNGIPHRPGQQQQVQHTTNTRDSRRANAARPWGRHQRRIEYLQQAGRPRCSRRTGRRTIPGQNTPGQAGRRARRWGKRPTTAGARRGGVGFKRNRHQTEEARPAAAGRNGPKRSAARQRNTGGNMQTAENVQNNPARAARTRTRKTSCRQVTVMGQRGGGTGGRARRRGRFFVRSNRIAPPGTAARGRRHRKRWNNSATVARGGRCACGRTDQEGVGGAGTPNEQNSTTAGGWAGRAIGIGGGNGTMEYTARRKTGTGKNVRCNVGRRRQVQTAGIRRKT